MPRNATKLNKTTTFCGIMSRKGELKLRTNLKVFRIQHVLSQEEIAAKIGCSRATYSAIENGTRAGRQMFWNSLQNAFDIPDADMFGLMKNDE